MMWVKRRDFEALRNRVEKLESQMNTRAGAEVSVEHNSLLFYRQSIDLHDLLRLILRHLGLVVVHKPESVQLAAKEREEHEPRPRKAR